MVESRDLELPVLGRETKNGSPDDAPSCSPSVYVTNEEATLLAAMRTLKDGATAIRKRLSTCTSEDERALLEDELERLRARRTELERRRDQAYRRKMVMLGHLPPDALLE